MNPAADQLLCNALQHPTVLQNLIALLIGIILADAVSGKDKEAPIRPVSRTPSGRVLAGRDAATQTDPRIGEVNNVETFLHLWFTAE